MEWKQVLSYMDVSTPFVLHFVHICVHELQPRVLQGDSGATQTSPNMDPQL